ncbi:amino acid adenylation domain-containing protein [Trichocoleus sp. FACHB-591]|uniref:non-ribosomal peptide synthetase n=1 Tax=Trichocoleus sp. FACHB-591 TaxID=2692872 RepID=UPI0016823485|nr:non-ribosomal peptide synthetase [Trichocoleus sp. FACHB-591]MBD2095647.1 amino acid adenylation domain-containing protein [Trichocoleus sp. FACHB-591]
MQMENIEDIYELSPTQQGLLFHTLHASESGVYFEQFCWCLEGSLDRSAFQQVWQRLCDRHSILRTAFCWEGLEQPYQVVYRQVELPWEEQDWRQIFAPEQEERLRNFLQEDRDRGFVLPQAPLMRCTLIRIDEEAHYFIWSHHHLLLDGWSTALLFKEILADYQALSQQQFFSLESPRPYRDYILWLQQQNPLSAEPFWRQYLQGFAAPTAINLEQPQSINSAGDRAEQQIYLPVATTQALKTFVQQQRLTLNTLVQAAWTLALSCYSGESDVVFGTVVAGRPPTLPGVESMVGLFINTLPLRVQVPPEAELIPWLQQLQAQQMERQTYEYSSLVQIRRWSEVPAALPLFNSILVFENYPIDTTVRSPATDLTIERVSTFEQTNYPLTITVVPGEELLLQATYNAQQFTNAAIARLLGHLQTLLEGFITQSQTRLQEISFLTPAERHQLLVEWNDLKHPSTSDPTLCLHHLFEAQVERTPDAIALIYDAQQLTYRKLNQRANQLAHHLQSLGVGPEVLVGVCLPRSPHLIISLLAILKAGGAYVPLDPNYPEERLSFMLADARVAVLLTQDQMEGDRIPTVPHCHRVALDTDWNYINQLPDINPESAVSAANLAYVIYTSGSTGVPKGVAIQHSSPVVLVEWAKTVFTDAELAGVLAATSICFDLSVFEIFVPLSWGGRVILAENALHLPTIPAASQVTLVNTVPSAIAALLQTGPLPDSVHTVNLAGEPLQPALVQRLYQQPTIEQVYNLYGPSEDTTYSTVALMQRGDWSTPSIGRAIAQTQIYLLDAHLRPVPIGVPGEIYIGGAGLARGYLNRPELTAERFIPNPFQSLLSSSSVYTSSTDHQNAAFSPLNPPSLGEAKNLVPPKFGGVGGLSDRLYKTGDLARYRSDGTLEFLGRIDHQVKIRGFRIELGEISAVLSQHPSVQEVIVVAREDQSDQARLVAYIVLAEGTNSDRPPASLHQAWRDYLGQRLPAYMAPAAFVILDAFPLTPNGKIDRQALPSPDFNLLELAAIAPPSTPTEVQLAQIWTELLQVTSIGLHDNFFELGGHSLLTTQLLSRIQTAFSADLPLRQLFAAPTIATLAALVDRQLQPDPIEQCSGVSSPDLMADTVLPTDIQPAKPFQPKAPEHLLLTGATGFLGAFLLAELLWQTTATIYCLVRAEDEPIAQQRLQRSLQTYKIGQDEWRDRIVAIPGDLAQPNLGLSAAQFQFLAETLDAIYHNGAWVHHALPYASLRAANVVGTETVLRLACQHRTKPVHLISTNSVFAPTAKSGVQTVWEQDVPNLEAVPDNGYVQTKWVAERQVMNARDRGLPVAIYRPGRISGDSQTGVFNANDFLYQLIIGCVQLGSAPEGQMPIDFIPVNYVSQAIVHLSLQPTALGQAFHLVNPHPLSAEQLIHKIRSLGYPLQRLPYSEWRSQLLEIAQHQPDHPLYPLIPMFPPATEAASSIASLHFDCCNTLAGLAGTSIHCPLISNSLLDTYFTYLIENGNLTPPISVAAHGNSSC